MPRYPYQGQPNGFQRTFNQGAYPSARYDSDEEENELDRVRELYKNLQGSPGGWQTRALQGQSQQLKRRLGETEKSFQEREVEYKRRIREGEDVRSLLGSQLDESRSQYGKLQRQLDESRSQYGDLQSQFGDERSLYHGRIGTLESQVNQRNKEKEEKRRAFQEAYDKDYIEKQLLPVVREKYPHADYAQSYDRYMKALGTNYNSGKDILGIINAWQGKGGNLVLPPYNPPQYPQKMDLYSRYGGLKTDYDNLQKRNSESESLYQNRMANFEKRQGNEFNQYINDPEIADHILLKKYNLDKNLAEIANRKPWDDVKKYAEQEGYTGDYKKPYKVYFAGKRTIPFPSYEEFAKRNHNKAFMMSLMPQFEKKYPKGDRDEAQHLSNLGYDDPTYSKDPVSFLKQYQKYYPFANEETYKKYPTTDKFRDLSPASKQYLNIDQPNFENFNKIYKQKLRDQESMSLGELQSQSERFSEMRDRELGPFAEMSRALDPEGYNKAMSISEPRFSQSSIYSQNAPSSFYSSIKSRYDQESNARKQNEMGLNQIKKQYDQHLLKSNQDTQKYENDKRNLTGEANLWKGKHDALLPVVQEYKNYRRDVSPLRQEHPQLKKFYEDYQNVDLGGYKDLPNYFKPLDQFKKNHQQLAQYDPHVKEFIRVWPGTKDKEFQPKQPFRVPNYEAIMPKSFAQLNELRSFAQNNQTNYQDMMTRRYMMESYARKYPDQAHNYGLKKLGLGNENIPAQNKMNPYPWAKR